MKSDLFQQMVACFGSFFCQLNIINSSIRFHFFGWFLSFTRIYWIKSVYSSYIIDLVANESEWINTKFSHLVNNLIWRRRSFQLNPMNRTHEIKDDSIVIQHLFGLRGFQVHYKRFSLFSAPFYHLDFRMRRQTLATKMEYTFCWMLYNTMNEHVFVWIFVGYVFVYSVYTYTSSRIPSFLVSHELL